MNDQKKIFSLTIELENEEMRTPEDIAKAIKTHIVIPLEGKDDWSLYDKEPNLIFDENGNKVGTWVKK